MEVEDDPDSSANLIPRHRNPVFNRDEIKLLIDLINEYKLLVLNKSNTTSACRAKEVGWAKITQKFNSHGFKHTRTINGLKFKWKNLLKDVRKLSKNILDVEETRGDFDELTSQVVSLMYDEDINIGMVVLPADLEDVLKDIKQQPTDDWNENAEKESEDSSGDDKIASRNRSMNFSPQECKLLLQCVRAEKKIVFNKGNTAKINNIKNKAWARITHKFNIQSPRKRSKKVLQTKFLNMKRIAKKADLKKFFKIKGTKHEKLLEENCGNVQLVKSEPTSEIEEEPMNDNYDVNDSDDQFENEAPRDFDDSHKVDPDPLSTVLSSDSGLGSSVNIDSFNPFENKEVSKLKIELLKQKIENAKLEKIRIESAIQTQTNAQESKTIERALRLRAARLEATAAEMKFPPTHPALSYTPEEAVAQPYLRQYQT